VRALHIHSGNLWGGVETVLVAMAAERGRCRHLQPEYALCFDGPLRRRLAATGVVQHDLGEVRWRSPHRVVAARRRLRELLRHRAYDAVVMHSMWAHSLFAPVVRHSAPRLVHWAHDSMDGRHWLQRWAGRTAPDLVIANSAFTAGGVPSVFPAMRPHVLYCPLSIDRQEKTAPPRHIRGEFATASDATVIVQVSRLEAWKGHEVLLDALTQLRDVPAWQCWVVGGAQRTTEKVYLESLHRRAAVGGIADRVRFVGQRDDVRDVLSAADVFCQPNLSAEPFGIALVEALAGGLPVVSAATGGALEIIDASCGELVSPRNPAVLAAVLRRLVEDPGRRRQLGSHGPARAAALCDPTRQLAALASLMAAATGPSARAEHV
jgi:glycosyltransferase involved in cell wall biosynthesis